MSALLFCRVAAAEDWSLAQAVQRGIQVQASLQSAQALARSAADTAQASQADRLPQLSLRAGSIWTESRNGQPVFAAANGQREVIGQAVLTAPLYAPQLSALAKLAKDQSAIAKSQTQSVRLQVATTLSNAWYAVLLAQNTSALWQRVLDQDRLLYHDTRDQFRSGATARLNLVQTQLLLLQARSASAQAQEALGSVRRNLRLQLQLPAGSPVQLAPTSTLPAAPAPLPQLWQEASQRQPLLQVAQAQLHAARAQVAVQRASLAPNIDVQAAYGLDSTQVPRPQSLGWQAGITLNLPLFGFGRRHDRIAAAQEQLAALRSARRALLLQIQTRINTDYGVYQQESTRLQQDRHSLAAARAVYHMTRAGFRAGALNALNLAQADQAWVQARLALIRAQIRAQMAATQLALDVGKLP